VPFIGNHPLDCQSCLHQVFQLDFGVLKVFLADHYAIHGVVVLRLQVGLLIQMLRQGHHTVAKEYDDLEETPGIRHCNEETSEGQPT
jgi:type III secretory pathway component EscU